MKKIALLIFAALLLLAAPARSQYLPPPQPAGSYQFVPEGYVVVKPDRTRPCGFCGYFSLAENKYCGECGKPFNETQAKPASVTYGQFLRAVDEIVAVQTDSHGPVPMKLVTVKAKHRFKEWKEIQQDDEGFYIILREKKEPASERAHEHRARD